MDDLLSQICDVMMRDIYSTIPLPRENARAVYERALEIANEHECSEYISLFEDEDGFYLRILPSEEKLFRRLKAKMTVWEDHVFNTDSLPIEDGELMGYTPYEAVQILSDGDPYQYYGWLPEPQGIWLGKIMLGRNRYGEDWDEPLVWIIDAEGIAWLENGSVSGTEVGGVCESDGAASRRTRAED